MENQYLLPCLGAHFVAVERFPHDHKGMLLLNAFTTYMDKSGLDGVCGVDERIFQIDKIRPVRICGGFGFMHKVADLPRTIGVDLQCG